MLSRNNKILIGCLALLLVMSVGYALFSDTITINGSATAKGDFSLTTEVVSDIDDEFFHQIYGGAISTGIVENPNISVIDNVVNASVTLGAPGSRHNFIFKVTNTGTIPAKLKSVYNVTTNSMIVQSGDDGAYSSDYCVGERTINMVCAYLYPDSGGYDDYESDFYSGERWFEGVFDSLLLEGVLDPGESAYYLLNFDWGKNSTVQGEPLQLDWSIKLNWEQVTN